MADAEGAAKQAKTATSPTIAAPTCVVRMLILSIFAAFTALASSLNQPALSSLQKSSVVSKKFPHGFP
jgi:hypothetical protein